MDEVPALSPMTDSRIRFWETNLHLPDVPPLGTPGSGALDMCCDKRRGNCISYSVCETSPVLPRGPSSLLHQWSFDPAPVVAGPALDSNPPSFAWEIPLLYLRRTAAILALVANRTPHAAAVVSSDPKLSACASSIDPASSTVKTLPRSIQPRQGCIGHERWTENSRPKHCWRTKALQGNVSTASWDR